MAGRVVVIPEIQTIRIGLASLQAPRLRPIRSSGAPTGSSVFVRCRYPNGPRGRLDESVDVRVPRLVARIVYTSYVMQPGVGAVAISEQLNWRHSHGSKL